MSILQWSEQDDGPIQDAFLKSARRWSREALLAAGPTTLAELLARICLQWTIHRHGGIILHNNKRCVALEFYEPMKIDSFPAISVKFCISNTLRQAKMFLRDEKFEVLECTALFDSFLEHLKMNSRCQRVTDVVSGAVLWDGMVVGLSKVDSRKKAGSIGRYRSCNYSGNSVLDLRLRQALSGVLDMLGNGVQVTTSQSWILCAHFSTQVLFILLNAIQVLYFTNHGSKHFFYLNAISFLSEPWFQSKVLGDVLFQVPYSACAFLQLNAEDCLPDKTLSLLYVGYALASNFPVAGTLLLNRRTEGIFIWMQTMSQLLMTLYIAVITLFSSQDRKKT